MDRPFPAARSWFDARSTGSLRRAVATLLIGLTGACVTPAPAAAQTAVAPMGASGALGHGSRKEFRPSFTRGDVHMFAETLGLDDNRKAIVEALLFDYESAFTAAAQSTRQELEAANPAPTGLPQVLREQQEELRREIQALNAESRRQSQATDDPDEKRRIREEFRAKIIGLRDEMRTRRTGDENAPDAVARQEAVASIMRGWGAERQRLRDDLTVNLEAVLSDDQRARWPGLLRTLRRREMLGRGFLSGESVDLIAMLDKQQLDDETRAALAPVRETYAVDLDEALLALHQTIASFGGAAKSEAEVHQEIGLRVALRDVNRAYADRFAEEMPGAERSQFIHAYHQAAYPSVYRPTPVQRLFDSAKRRRTINEEQLLELEDLESEYLGQLVTLNAGVRDATLAHEAEQLRARMVGRLGASEPKLIDPSTSPIRAALAKRREVEARFTERLQQMMHGMRTAYPKADDGGRP